MVDDKSNEFVLANGSRIVHVALIRHANAFTVRHVRRRASSFAAILTVHADNLPLVPAESIVVIDVMRSEVVAGDFPDSVYGDLFNRFVKGGPAGNYLCL